MATLAQVVLRDTRANQPAAGTAGRLYYVTDESVLERDSGSAWQSVEGAGGLADHGVVTYFDFTNASAPSTPSSGKTRIYTKTDKAFYQKDDAGVETSLAGGSSGSTILARYTRTTAQSIANNSSTIVDYATSVRDTNSAVTTGASWHFTAPSTLDYVVIAALIFDVTATWGDGEIATLELWKNGSAYSTLDWKDNNGGTGYKQLSGSDTVRLTAGDTLAIHVLQLSGGPLNLLNSGQYNFVNIYSLP